MGTKYRNMPGWFTVAEETAPGVWTFRAARDSAGGALKCRTIANNIKDATGNDARVQYNGRAEVVYLTP